MKMSVNLVKTISIGMMLLASGCAIPTMNLKHEASVASIYPTKGKITIEKFADNRPGDQKILKQTAVNKLTPQIWSGNTSPEMLTFFQSVIEAEATRTLLFTSGQGEYTLSGKVSSLKVDRKCTVFRYLLGIFDFPKLEATVVYDVTLSKNGQPVVTKSISHTKSEKYWALTEVSWTQISNKMRRLLDDAITETIKMMFDDVDKQVK